MNRLKSTNFYVNVLTLAFIAIHTVFGVTVNLDPEQTVVAFLAKDMEFILSIALPALFNIGFKIFGNIKAGLFDLKALLKSSNFWTQAVTVIAAIIAAVGILLPDNAPTELVNAFFGGSIIAIITAVIANVINPVWHWIKDRKNTNE